MTSRTARVLKALPSFVFLIASLATAARASDVVIPITASQTTVAWTLGALLHTVHGTFAVKDSSLHFDPQSNTIRGAVEIDLSMAKTGDAKRDRKMHDEGARVRQISHRDVHRALDQRPFRAERSLAM